MSTPDSLRWLKHPVMVTYGVPVLSVGAALIIARWLDTHFHNAPVSLFICAVMFSAWFGGFRPGLLATVLSCLAFIYYFVPPTYSFAVETAQIPRAALFALAALLVGSLSARQRSAGEALRKSEQRYRDYIETLSDWLWDTGPDHRFTQISVLSFEGQRRVREQRQDFATDVEEEPEKWRLEWGRGHAGGPAGPAQDGRQRDG